MNLKDERRRSFFMVDNEVLDDYDLSVGAFWLYSTICRESMGKGKWSPRLNELAKKPRSGKSKGVTPNCLRNWREELVVKNLIRIEEHEGQPSTCIILDVPKKSKGSNAEVNPSTTVDTHPSSTVEGLDQNPSTTVSTIKKDLKQKDKSKTTTAASPNGEPKPQPQPATIVDNCHPEMRLASALDQMARELPVKVAWPRLEPKIERWMEDQEGDIGKERYRAAWRDWVLDELASGRDPHPVAFAKHMEGQRKKKPYPSKGTTPRYRGDGHEKREPQQDESSLPSSIDQMWRNKGLPVDDKERAKVLAERRRQTMDPEHIKRLQEIVDRSREKSKVTRL